MNSEEKNVELIFQTKIGWPYDTLMRFHFFSSIQEKLKEFDYIFFFNANTNFVKRIDVSILENGGVLADLIVTNHPFFHWVTNPKDFPYERNRKSAAFIPFGKGSNYVIGGFNGGKSSTYLELIDTLKYNVDTDKKKGIVAKWHDESHLNKYIFESKKNIKILDYNFGFPQGHDLPLGENIYIQFLDKASFGGHDFLREKKNSIPVTEEKKSSFNLLKRIRRFASKGNSH